MHKLLFQGFIVPHLLSVEECEEVIQMGEDWGIGEEDFKLSEDKRIRTSNRTTSYVNEELTIRYMELQEIGMMMNPLPGSTRGSPRSFCRVLRQAHPRPV